MELVADFLITQRGIKLFSGNRRWHTHSVNTGAGSDGMNGTHQLPTDTAFLMRRINENAPDYLTVETGSADDGIAQQGYQNLALDELYRDGFRSKVALNLSDDIGRVVL